MYNRYISEDIKPQFIDYSSKFPTFILNLKVETTTFDKLNGQYNSQIIEVYTYLSRNFQNILSFRSPKI